MYFCTFKTILDLFHTSTKTNNKNNKTDYEKGCKGSEEKELWMENKCKRTLKGIEESLTSSKGSEKRKSVLKNSQSIWLSELVTWLERKCPPVPKVARPDKSTFKMILNPHSFSF